MPNGEFAAQLPALDADGQHGYGAAARNFGIKPRPMLAGTNIWSAARLWW